MVIFSSKPYPKELEEKENEELKKMFDEHKLNTTVVKCKVCNSQNISHEEKEGRGLPPKDYVKKQGDNRKISWRGIWDVWTCNDCGDKTEKLRRD
jgi:hypothetical protein